MEILFEFLIQFVGECLVQGGFEMAIRGIYGLIYKDSEEAEASILLTLSAYIFMGLIAGAISVWLLPMQLLASPILQILNLAITPIALGFLFELLGRWRENHDKPRFAVDRFLYGFLFALTMGVIRYLFAA